MRRVLRSVGRELGSRGRGLAVAFLSAALALAGAGPRRAHGCAPETACTGTCAETPAAAPSCCAPDGPSAEPERESASVGSGGCACAVDAGGAAMPALLGSVESTPFPSALEVASAAPAAEDAPAGEPSGAGAPREARPRSPGIPLFLSGAALLI